MAIVRSVVARIRALFAWWFADIGKRKSFVGKAASLLIGLFVLCCVCSVGLAAVRSTGQAIGLVATNTPSPQPTLTQAPTNTPEPSATTAPSATPVPEPPTEIAITPEPTTGPTPEETPTPTAANALTSEERQAVAEMGTQLGNIGQGLGKIGELSRNADLSDAWKIQMAAAILLVRNGHAALVEMKVPPKIEHLHGSVVDATTDCNAAMDKLVSGIDKASAKDLQAGGALMRSCGSKIQDARPELDALLSQS